MTNLEKYKKAMELLEELKYYSKDVLSDEECAERQDNGEDPIYQDSMCSIMFDFYSDDKYYWE